MSIIISNSIPPSQEPQQSIKNARYTFGLWMEREKYNSVFIDLVMKVFDEAMESASPEKKFQTTLHEALGVCGLDQLDKRTVSLVTENAIFVLDYISSKKTEIKETTTESPQKRGGDKPTFDETTPLIQTTQRNHPFTPFRHSGTHPSPSNPAGTPPSGNYTRI
jgi:hypothetical protein